MHPVRVLENTITPNVIAEKRGAAGWLIFNDPGRHNAISMEMWAAVPQVLNAFVDDSDVRLIVLSGAGERAFVSGANIGQFDSMRSGRDLIARYDAFTGAALESLHQCKKPTVAKIRGYCIGGGISIAASCDIRIASEESAFSIPAARLGIGYRFSAIRDLVTVIGAAHCLDLLLSARKFNTAHAQAIGLIQHRVPDADLDRYMEDYILQLSHNAPLSMFTTKQMVRQLCSPHSGVNEAALNELVAACFASEDYNEGKRAFAEKRAPVFRGI
jgi:enoyl-CoA hydratase